MLIGKYLSGEKRTEYAHPVAGSGVMMDATSIEKGYSPTDLLAMSLASCVATTIGAKAALMGKSIEGATWTIEDAFLDNPRRLGEIKIVYDFTAFNFTEKEQTIFERVARFCTVGHSLHPDLKQIKIFKW